VKLLTVMYLGRRHVNLRTDAEVRTPADLAGIKLRMPGTDAWQFLGSALGANPVPVAFGEVYTALQTGAIDGQDNPLPTNRDSKFYEVTKQIVLTSHLVDLNYLALSKKVWDEFTPEQQAVVQKAADDAAEQGRQTCNCARGGTRPVLQGPGAEGLRAGRRGIPQRRSSRRISPRNTPRHGLKASLTGSTRSSNARARATRAGVVAAWGGRRGGGMLAAMFVTFIAPDRGPLPAQPPGRVDGGAVPDALAVARALDLRISACGTRTT
jgi:hypothetical protein